MSGYQRASTATLALLLTLVFASPSKAESPATVDPESVGMSSERLARIDRLFQDSVDRRLVKGVVGLIARKNRVVYHEAFGEMDVGVPMKKDSIFRICSMSKPITSVAVMMLWEEGLFTLNDPLAKYIPAFEAMKVVTPDEDSGQRYTLVPAKTQITVRHLLTHTSGISYGFSGQPLIAQCYLDNDVSDGLSVTSGTLAEGVKRLAACPLLFEPGDGYEYGLNYDVLGRLVEVLSGVSFDVFLEKRLFGPLKMNDTHFSVPEEKVSRLAAVFVPGDDGTLTKLDGKVVAKAFNSETMSLIYDPFYSIHRPKTYFSGGAGLNSTASDYLRFCQMMLNGGTLDGVQILSPTTIDLMLSNDISRQGVRDGLRMGLGFAVVTDRAGSAMPLPNGTYLWGGFYFTAFYIDPEHQMIAMFLGQLFPYGRADELNDKVWALSQAAIKN